MKKIVVTGAGGQLGSELQQLAPLYPSFEFLFENSETLPVHNQNAVTEYFRLNQPDYCINCAAYTAVDKAESEPEKAMLVNGTSVGYLASVSNENNCRFIHISTDYVFDGTAKTPIKETDPVNPLGAYGISKLKGEELAMLMAPDSLVIRTSWVYSSYGNNFVKTMLRLMAEREVLNVVNDQFGSPTFAADLGKAILDIIVLIDKKEKNPAGGIYHYGNEGAISWYEFALAIKEMANLSCTIQPIPTAMYPTPARRPAYSVFDKEKISKEFGLTIYPWKDSLQSCILQIRQFLAK
jgi:dTDP-4-dehydrorhamnose reductase